MGLGSELLATKDPFPDHLPTEVARALIELARSPRSEDVDLLIEVAMTRGLRHPRFAIDAIEAESGQRFARRSVDLAEQSAKMAQLLLWVTALAALAAVVNVVAVVLS